MTQNKAFTYTQLPDHMYQLTPHDLNEELTCLVFNTDANHLFDHAFNHEADLRKLIFDHKERVIAQAYAGHQFGHFTLLGDGRAHLLDERMGTHGNLLDLHLKGSGATPYSRRGDGKATLGPMLREYLMSDAMAALGIPTSRSLAVYRTHEAVHRERPEEGAVLVRLASSHLRVGTFQFTAVKDPHSIYALVDFALNRHKISLDEDDGAVLSLFRYVVAAQAKLIAQWQAVGFIHGVMNTDNMTISGETIDYGPCAMMDTYHLNTVYSSIDHQGRYAYGNQPTMAGWNLARFAEALLTLDPDNQDLRQGLEKDLAGFGPLFNTHYQRLMLNKLGLVSASDETIDLVKNLLQLLTTHASDYTLTFTYLTQTLQNQDYPYKEALKPLLDSPAFKAWYMAWQKEISQLNQESVIKTMKAHNPVVIPRNYWVDQALKQAEAGDMTLFTHLNEILKTPFDDKHITTDLAGPPPSFEVPFRTYCGT